MKEKRRRVGQSSNLPEDFVIDNLAADAFWMVPKSVGRQIGLENAVFLSELIAKYRYWRERGQLQADGSFFMTSDDIQQVMGCSERMAKRLTKSIQDCGVARVIKRGVPAKNHWILCWDFIAEILSGGRTSQAGTDLTGRAGSDLTGEAETDLTITKKSDLEPKPKKEIAPEGASLYGRVVKLIGDAHKALSGEDLSWVGYEQAYGAAVKQIIRQAEGSKEAMANTEEVFGKIRAKVEAYFRAARAESSQARRFYTEQGITPLSIRSAWNKLVTARGKSSMEPARDEFPDVMKMPAAEIEATFGEWQKKFSISQVREGLPKPIWDKWQRDKNGFAGALSETILAYVSENFDWGVLVGNKKDSTAARVSDENGGQS